MAFGYSWGIDGFSRLLTYLKCSNNNRSDTVIDYFIMATEKYGIPSRLRLNHGGENVGIWRFMEEVRGPDRGSYIAGRSVHNTRIERDCGETYTLQFPQLSFQFSKTWRHNIY